MGCLCSQRPIKNISSHSVLKSSDSYKKSTHSANFDIGRLWSRRPIENLSSHSVLKSSHLVIAKISKKKFLLEIAELSNLGLKKIFHQKKIFSDFVKFRYGLSMESNTSKKSSLALSFKILALSIEIYGLLLKIFALSQF